MKKTSINIIIIINNMMSHWSRYDTCYCTSREKIYEEYYYFTLYHEWFENA